MNYADGSSYDGDWEDDLKQGTGIFTWKNGK